MRTQDLYVLFVYQKKMEGAILFLYALSVQYCRADRELPVMYMAAGKGAGLFFWMQRPDIG